MKIKSQNLEPDVPKKSDHIQIKVKMPNPSEEPPASPNAPNQNIPISEFSISLILFNHLVTKERFNNF